LVRTSPTQLQRLGEVPEEVLASHRRELIDARAYEKACGALATCMGAESSLIARGTTLGALCRGLGALCMGFGAECRGMEALCRGVMALCRGFGAKAEGLRVMSKACTCPLEALPHSQLPKRARGRHTMPPLPEHAIGQIPNSRQQWLLTRGGAL
jgi:hypothetical protein